MKIAGNALRRETMEGTGREEIIYGHRFSDEEDATRAATWRCLVAEFFQTRIPTSAVVLDLGAGDGKFIKNIQAARRIAVDISPHVQALEREGISVINASATEFRSQLTEPVDVIFMSNFLEHLPNKRLVLEVLAECYAALRSGGRVMVLQPNIRYVGSAYWDYIDHHIALTERSLVEALEVNGFEISEIIPRFLPYTARSTAGKFAALLKADRMVSWYLKFPLLWKIFGQQTFVVGRKK